MPKSDWAARSIATASSSVFSPHQPVERVQVPKPISLALMSVPGNCLYRILDGSWWKRKLTARRRPRRKREAGSGYALVTDLPELADPIHYRRHELGHH